MQGYNPHYVLRPQKSIVKNSQRKYFTQCPYCGEDVEGKLGETLTCPLTGLEYQAALEYFTEGEE